LGFPALSYVPTTRTGVGYRIVLGPIDFFIGLLLNLVSFVIAERLACRWCGRHMSRSLLWPVAKHALSEYIKSATGINRQHSGSTRVELSIFLEICQNAADVFPSFSERDTFHIDKPIGGAGSNGPFFGVIFSSIVSSKCSHH
jgi:hypothetical protein